jgi:proteasome alpha subunit
LYTPYDWQQNIAHRAQYVEGRLRGGSPVIGVSCDEGVVLVTMRGGVRKIFEIYDRLLFGGVGSQADLESLRVAAIDFAHSEGFTRSEDDVTVQRVVGFALSPSLKKAFGDPSLAPFVARALFAEMGATPEADRFVALNYDGEYSPAEGYAVVAGSSEAEEAATSILQKEPATKSADTAAATALRAWGAARLAIEDADKREPEPGESAARVLKEAEEATPEIGWLERHSPRQSKFSLWPKERVDTVLKHLR